MRKPDKTLKRGRDLTCLYRGNLLDDVVTRHIRDEQGNIVKTETYALKDISFYVSNNLVRFYVEEEIPNPDYERQLEQYEAWKAKKIAELEDELKKLRGES